MKHIIVNKLILIFSILFYFCLSCKESSKEISKPDIYFPVEINIDSLFINFDVETYEKSRYKIIHEIYTPDSLYKIIQKTQDYTQGYLQIVQTASDSLFYDMYSYYPNGILQKKSTHFKLHPALWGTYYEFNEQGELITFIDYNNKDALDLSSLISFVGNYGYDFFDWSVTFGIKYRNKQEYSDSIAIYTKYSNPLYCIEMADYDSKTIHYISLDGISGEIETDCFFNGETIVCEKGSEEDLQSWSSPVF